MPNFRYRATNMAGKTVSGKLTAADPDALNNMLREKSLYLLDYKMEQVGGGGGLSLPFLKGKKKLKSAELCEFCRQLGTLLNAGVSIIQAFKIIGNRQSASPAAKKIFGEITVDLKHGKSLSEAMTDQGSVFPELLISMVRSGEASGKIGDTFVNMGEHFQKSNRIKKQVKGALAYPIVLMVLLVAVIILMFTFILPMFGDMFENTELPATTRFMMAMSDFMINRWYVLIIAVVLLIIGIRVLKKTPATKLIMDRMLLKIPKIGPLVKIVYTANFSRTLASLYTSGLSILNALQISRGTVTNTYLRSQFDDCIKKIRIGTALSESISEMDGFDSKLADTIKVGEETGKLDAMLTTTADDYEYESSNAIKSMTSIIEPIMIMLLAGVVAVVMISVLVPMYSMYGNIDENSAFMLPIKIMELFF